MPGSDRESARRLNEYLDELGWPRPRGRKREVALLLTEVDQSSAREPRPHACAAICGPTTVTSGIGCIAHRGGSTPAASAAIRAQWRSKPAGVQTST